MSDPYTIGIDPGPFKSTAVWFDGERVFRMHEVANEEGWWQAMAEPYLPVFVEDFQPYGVNLSEDSIRTIKFIGLLEYWGARAIARKRVKLELCGTLTRVGDSEVRSALIERFGPGREVAVGRKKCPGPLYGVSGHAWPALAVAVVGYDEYVLRRGKRKPLEVPAC